MDEAMEEVRCRGCGRLLGVAPTDYRIYCDEQCSSDFPALAAEARDALIETVYQTKTSNKAGIAREFGISRQRVDQILAQRDLRS